MVPNKGDGTSRFLIGPACLRIAKFSSVIVSTHELVLLPGNVTGKFNLKIKMALRGLFVQMGTQVEPNYHGRLFALLQNISDEEIVIEPQSDTNKIFAIEFYYTSHFVPTESSDFGKSKVEHIGQFVKEIAFSGTINNITTEIEQRLQRLEESNAGLSVDLKAVSSRLEDVIPQVNQAAERLFSVRSLIMGAVLISVIAIIRSVVAPVVAKLLLDSKSIKVVRCPLPPGLELTASTQSNIDDAQSSESAAQPLRRPSVYRRSKLPTRWPTAS